MHCSNCGAEIKEGVRFCTNCGKAQVLEEKINVQNIQHQQEENIKQQKTIRKQEPRNELKNTNSKRKFINKKRWIICIVTTIIFIVVLGGFISTKFIKAKEVNDNMNLGNKYLQEGKYEEAILAFEKIIQIDPKSVDARIEVSKAYVNMKEYNKAESVLREAMDIDTKNSRSKEELVNLYILQGKELMEAQKYDKAQGYFNKAIELSKEDVSIYLDISENYLAIDQLDEAVKILEKGYKEIQDDKIKIRLEELNEKVNEKLIVGYWKGTGKYFSENISFYPNKKFVRITMGGSGGSGWRGTYKFDNNNIGILTGDGYSYLIGHNGGQTKDLYTAKIKIINTDSILIYEFFDECVSYIRVGEAPAPGTNYIDPN